MTRQRWMIDLFCGRGGWTKGFLKMGWRVRGIDLNPQPDYPKEAEFVQADILTLTAADLMDADFICCSSPCEEFSVHCMKHFHPNPPYPTDGIKLFRHAEKICIESGKQYVMENVRCAEKFVGRAVNHCGPFYLWGNAVPAVMPREMFGLKKGLKSAMSLPAAVFAQMTREDIRAYRRANSDEWRNVSSKSKERKEATAKAAEIPHRLSEYLASTAR